MTSDADLKAYVSAVRRLLDHGGYERTGNVAEAKKWDIDHIVAFLAAQGRPDRRRTVHIAGSKGKGSTATIVESILRAAGAHTLLETSPDLHQSRERIAIDGTALDHAQFAAVAERLLDEEASEGWSYFELLTVMGWLAAAEAGCDWQVLECGLGGRLDTTNAAATQEGEKAVAVVTPIDLEHTAILGETIPAIAAEKAGIITPGCQAVVSPMRASALEVVRARAEEVGAPLHVVEDECAMRVAGHTLEGQRIDLKTPLRTYRGLRLPLAGPHQAQNAATAVLAAELAWAAAGEELPEAAVKDGIAGVRCPGRFEVLKRSPLVIVDAMHTPLSARRFRQTVAALSLPAQRVYVVGLLEGKETEAIADALVEPGETVLVAPPASPRAADPSEIAAAFTVAGASVQQAPAIAGAVEIASAIAGDRGAVFIVGGLVTAAEAREELLAITGDRAFGLR
ncbi:MAG: Mur ligase family protein [Dehalococcoidia bacterium]